MFRVILFLIVARISLHNNWVSVVLCRVLSGVVGVHGPAHMFSFVGL